MLEALRWAAPVVALAALAFAVRARYVARVRAVHSPSINSTILVSMAIIIGSLPPALDVQDSTIRVVTIVVSMALSIVAIVMVLRTNHARTNDS
jgi:hypothetical protein